MLVLKDENVTKQDQENENNEQPKVDVVEVGQPDEALLWERRFRRQSKSKQEIKQCLTL